MPYAFSYCGISSSTPLTGVVKFPFARNDSTYGISMRFVTFAQEADDTSPIASTENEVPVSHAASAEAIFSGCCWNSSLPWASPVIATAPKPMIATTAPTRSVLIQTRWSSRSRPGCVGSSPGTTLPCASTASIPSRRRFHSWYQPMPRRKPPATPALPAIVCEKATSAVLFVSTAQTSVIRGRPSTSATPTGCCIHEFATMMKYALSTEAPAAMARVRRWRRFGSRRQPKIQRPRNVDSTKKASSASIASGAPNTSPTNRAVLAPGETELELLDDASRDTDDEVDEVDLPPEPRHAVPTIITRAHPAPLHEHQRGSEPDRERDEQEVVDGGDAELPSGDRDDIHGFLHVG